MTKKPWPPAPRSCPFCGASYGPKSTNQVYCSSACKEKAKHLRIKADPERWDAAKRRARERYVPTGGTPGPPPTHIGCSMDGCEEKHLARGFCRRHYYKDRRNRGLTDRKGRSSEPDLVSALVKRYDEAGEFIEPPRVTRIRVTVTSTIVIPRCPSCHNIMTAVRTSRGPDLRDCLRCRLRASLNAEEVEWLTSQARSTERPKRTAS